MSGLPEERESAATAFLRIFEKRLPGWQRCWLPSQQRWWLGSQQCSGTLFELSNFEPYGNTKHEILLKRQEHSGFKKAPRNIGDLSRFRCSLKKWNRKSFGCIYDSFT
jgi:hypothetical protein